MRQIIAWPRMKLVSLRSISPASSLTVARCSGGKERSSVAMMRFQSLIKYTVTIGVTTKSEKIDNTAHPPDQRDCRNPVIIGPNSPLDCSAPVDANPKNLCTQG